MKTLLGIDVGTQSTKVILYDAETKKVLDQASSPHELISSDDGTREQKAEWWITALEDCFSKLDNKAKLNVQAIGVSGQQHGFVPLDKNGHVLFNVKLWCDTATSAECEEMTSRFGGSEKILSEVGNQILPGYTVPKIAWLKKHHPEKYEKMATVFLPHDYINYYLTGSRVMEYGDASGTGLLDIRNKCWSKEAMQALDPERDISVCFPELIQANAPAGFLKDSVAEKMGLQAGVLVSSGGGDNMMGAIGTGTVAPGRLTLSLGTSGTLYGYSEMPVIDPAGNLAAFCSSTGGYLPLLCTMNCTVASELTRKLFNLSIEDLENSLSQTKPGAGGLTTLPFYNGERTPNLPNGKGCLLGMTPENLSQENILRSALEAAIFGMRLGLNSFQELGFSANEIRLIGGGSGSQTWRQITADILNLPVVVPIQEETAAFGASLQALWALKTQDKENISIQEITDEHVTLDTPGTCLPIKENVTEYGKPYETYKKYINALSPLFS